MTAGEGSDAVALVEEIRKAEGEEGVSWRFAKAAVVIDRVRRGTSHDLEEARLLTAEISQRRPLWANGFALAGEIADLSGSDDQAIWDYLKAVELGSVQPSLIRRLVGLLNERQRFDEIDHLTHVLRDQGAALNEVTVIQALDAISKRDFERGIALARNVFPQTSTSYSDHLTLGRLLMAAGRSDDAGKEFQRSVELGPGVPESWLTYVQYLVQTKQTDQARAAAAAARNALPADRSELAVAQCSMITGDPQRAEALIQEVLRVKPQDHAALRLAASLYSGQNRVDKAHEYLDRLDSSAANSAYDKAWTNRSRAALRLKSGRNADRDRALGLVEQNLKTNPGSIEDQTLRATILALRPDRQAEAIKILEQMAGANRLGGDERFLLARLYLAQREPKKYQDEMLGLLNLRPRDTRHLVHFADFLIGCNQLDDADRWLAELKKVEPQGLSFLELEVRLLDLRKRRPEVLARLEAFGREFPNEIGTVADLLNRYGFPKEAEQAYRAFVARTRASPADPGASQVPGSPGSSRRGDGDLRKSLVNLPAGRRRHRCHVSLRCRIGGRDSKTPGRSLGGRRRPQAA